MQDTPSRYDWLVSLGQFAAWMLTSVGAIIDALYVRQALVAILQALRGIQTNAYQQSGGIGIDFQFGYALSAVDDVMLLILGCAALAAVIAIEYYFRKGGSKNLLWKRIAKVVGVEVGIFLVMILILTFI